MAHRPVSGFASEQVTVGGWIPANRLFLAGHVVQYPPYKGILVIRTPGDGVHFPPGFILAFCLSLTYAVLKGSIHMPLNQIQLLIRQKALRFANVNAGNREALPPGLRYHAIDRHEVRGLGLFQAPIHIVKCCRPSLGWQRLSLRALIDTLSSR